mgnify:CR=1 FL=1
MSQKFEQEVMGALGEIHADQKYTVKTLDEVRSEQTKMHSRINRVERHQATWTGGAMVGGALLGVMWQWLKEKVHR